jgi:hypothetical protein
MNWIGFDMSGAIRRYFLALEVWVQSQVVSCDAVGGRSENVTWFGFSSRWFHVMLLVDEVRM